MSDFERDQFNPQPGTPDSSFLTTNSGPIIGLPTGFHVSQKLFGCGCFGLSAIAFLIGSVMLVVIVAGFLIPDWRANNRYIQNSGVVLDKRLDSRFFEHTNAEGQPAGKQECFRPEIRIRYEVGGRKIEVWTYDAFQNYSPDRAAQQAIIDSFEVGATYPCWYDPDRPDQSVLVRGYSWGAYVFLILPAGLLTVGLIGILIAWRVTAGQRAERNTVTNSGGFPPDAPGLL